MVEFSESGMRDLQQQIQRKIDGAVTDVRARAKGQSRERIRQMLVDQLRSIGVEPNDNIGSLADQIDREVNGSAT